MDEVSALTEDAIRRRVFPGCVIGVSRRGVRSIFAYGRETYEADAPPVTRDSVYDLASVTKSIVTATLALQLIDEGSLALDGPIARHIPEFRSADARIRHLLTYTLGNRIRLASLGDRSADAILAAICAEECAPGEAFSYSNAPALLLGVIIERILEMPLEAAARERIFEPLGLQATFAPRYAVQTEEGVSGVHDESARAFARGGHAAGHAGLFAHASDLLTFLEATLARDDARLYMNQIPGLGSCALGWELDQPWMGEKHSSRTFGKTGFTGTSVLCDPDERLAVVILSNRIHPRRPADASAIGVFRANVHDAVRS